MSDDSDYEARLQRRLKILMDQVKAGNVQIADGLRLNDSLKRVRQFADGSFDLSTVDGLVRSAAIPIEFFQDRQEMKQEISLAEIQSLYFEFIEKHFGWIYKQMVEKGASPHDIAKRASRDDKIVKELIGDVPKLLGMINQFWDGMYAVCAAHVEDMVGPLKCLFGGDLFPANDGNIASKCGIYADTIILPDPFVRSKYVFQMTDDSSRVYYLLKHALNLLKYKNLACADINPPIVVVMPDESFEDSDVRKYYMRLGQIDALVHAQRMFGRAFSSFEELMEYSDGLDTTEKAEKAVVDPSLVLIDIDWKRDVAHQLAEANRRDYMQMVDKRTPGRIITGMAFGSLSTMNELISRSCRLNAVPLIEAPTSWQYYLWKQEYDTQRVYPDNYRDMHVVKALQTLSNTDMTWIGNIPVDALIEMRKTGAMAEIRSILSKGISEVISTNPDNFHRTTDKVFENVDKAFAEHNRRLNELSAKKWRFAGVDLASCLVSGTFAISAIATGSIPLGISAFLADQLLSPTTLRELPKSIKELVDEGKCINHSPVGMLVKYSKRCSLS